MKFIVLVLAVLVLLWLLKGATQRRVRPPTRKPEGSAAPHPMVTCAHCGLHLPQGESLPGRGGVFCGEAHRAEYEKKHPPA